MIDFKSATRKFKEFFWCDHAWARGGVTFDLADMSVRFQRYKCEKCGASKVVREPN